MSCVELFELCGINWVIRNSVSYMEESYLCGREKAVSNRRAVWKSVGYKE